VRAVSGLRWLLLALCAVTAGAAAQDSLVIYRCTAADGAVTVQNDQSCPKGSRQERRVVETAAPSAPYVPPAISAPAAAPSTQALVAVPAAPPPPEPPPLPEVETDIEQERRPPPPLFACRTWERKDYLTDSAVPAERCMPMRTTGLDGDPTRGAGSACMMVTDACQPVPAAELCERWRQLLQASEATVAFGRAEDPAAAEAELERVRAIVDRNLCDGTAAQNP
jgi:hypothetical protein